MKNNYYDELLDYIIPLPTDKTKVPDPCVVMNEVSVSDIAQSELHELYARREKLIALLHQYQGISIPYDVCASLRKETDSIDRKTKMKVRSVLRAASTASDMVNLVTVQLWLCDKDIALFETDMYTSQSSSPKEREPKSQICDDSQDIVSPEAIHSFLKQFPLLDPIELCSQLKQRRGRLINSLAGAIPDVIWARSRSAKSIDDDMFFRRDYTTLCTIDAILKELDESERVKSAEEETSQKNQPLKSNEGSASKTPKSKDDSESNLRKQKTLIVNITRWEQLDWTLPIKGFTKADYQQEVNRRNKLAGGSSTKHYKVTSWTKSINDYLKTVNSDGNARSDLASGWTGLDTGTPTFNSR